MDTVVYIVQGDPVAIDAWLGDLWPAEEELPNLQVWLRNRSTVRPGSESTLHTWQNPARTLLRFNLATHSRRTLFRMASAESW